MKTTKPNDQEIGKLITAAQSVKSGNRAIADGKKLVETGKEYIADWLAKNRAIELDKQPFDEVVSIQGVCVVQIGSQVRFDEKAFMIQHPELHAQFMRKNKILKFIV
jgi:hypothetical protein